MNTKPKLQTLKTPKIGHYWHGQGGVYAGLIRDGDRQWHLIMATGTNAAIKSTWGEYGATIEGEFSRLDGIHNTNLILAAEPNNKAAQFVTNLSIDGCQDFYWPAQYENNLLCMNLPDHTGNGWHWSSTQYSARSAWVTNFGDGYQHVGNKDTSCAVRAVRRLPI